MGTSQNPLFWKLSTWGCLNLSGASTAGSAVGTAGTPGVAQGGDITQPPSDELRETQRGWTAVSGFSCLWHGECFLPRAGVVWVKAGQRQSWAALSFGVFMGAGAFWDRPEPEGTWSLSQNTKIKLPNCFGVCFPLECGCSMLCADTRSTQDLWADHGWCYNLDKSIYFTCKCPTIVFIT